MSDVHDHIRGALRSLQAATRPLGVFGSEAHGFETNPPLAEDAIRRFELAHRIVLPTEYREFLSEVGDGGAGPGYGLFELGEMDENHGHGPWHEGDGFVGVLSEPFPHDAPWNDLSGEPERDEGPDFDEDDWEERYTRWDATYWDSANVNGAIPICHLGCACRQWLIVTGPESGHIWCDDRADNRGLYPLERDGMTRVSFLTWYQSWLHDTLNLLRA